MAAGVAIAAGMMGAMQLAMGFKNFVTGVVQGSKPEKKGPEDKEDSSEKEV